MNGTVEGEIINPIIMKALTGLSIIGALMVSNGSPLAANILWSVANPLIAWHNYRIAQREQAFLFGVFAVIAWYGVYNLGV